MSIVQPWPYHTAHELRETVRTLTGAPLERLPGQDLEPEDIADIAYRFRSGDPEFVIAAHYAVPESVIVEVLRTAESERVA